MRMSGESCTGKWLFISLILLHLKMSSFVWIRWGLWGYNWRAWWCFVMWGARSSHNPMLLFFFFSSKQGKRLDLVTCAFSVCTSRIFMHLTPLCLPSGDMLDLLKWRAHPERINDSLSKLKEIDGSEIVKVGQQTHSRPWFGPAFSCLVRNEVSLFCFNQNVFKVQVEKACFVLL